MSHRELAIAMFVVLVLLMCFELYVVHKDEQYKNKKIEEDRKRAAKLKPFHFNPSQDEWY